MKRTIAYILVSALSSWAAERDAQGIVPLLERRQDGLLEAAVFPQANYFRQHFRSVNTAVRLRPPVRLADFVVAGKLELSLKNYIELVMANNTDIEIQRVTLETPRNAITRAFAPFDPLLTASFNNQRTSTQSTNILEGAETLKQLSQPLNFSYTQTLQTGTQFNAGLNMNKTSSNNSFTYFNPALNGQMTFGFTQPLLRGRGRDIQRLPISIARSRLRSAEYGLEDQVMRLLSLAETAYWDVVGSRENLRVQENALALNAEALKRSKRELELGAISQLDIYQPEAQYKSAEIQVLQARFRLQQSEDALRRQIGADLDPDIRKLPVVLTEGVLPPAGGGELDRDEIVAKAFMLRPDLKTIRTNLDIDDLNARQAANALRPDLSLRGTYVSTGRGGPFYPRQTSLGPSSPGSVVIPGGWGDAFDQIFGFGFPIWSFGLTLRLPLRDRTAEAGMADAMVSKKLNTLRQRQTEQQARLEVLQACSQVESSRASIDLAVVQRDLAQKQLDAEQKKYDLGITNIFFVLDAQTRLVNAESQLVNTSVQYRRNLLNLLRVTGDLLNERGVTVQ